MIEMKLIDYGNDDDHDNDGNSVNGDVDGYKDNCY